MRIRSIALAAAVLLGFGTLTPAVADDLPDPADPTALLDITKTVAPTTVGPGDEVTYTIQIGCSAISDVGCRNAITTDVIPAPLVIDDVVPSGPNDWDPPEIDGQKVTVTWVERLGGSVVGMLDNQTSQVTISAHVPDDVSYDLDGQTIKNLATAEATNADDVTDSVEITLDIPLDLATSASKKLDPSTAIAGEDADVTASLTGSNDSNATVDSLTIQDPVDPSASPNPFIYLGFTGFGDITPPAGTTSTTCEVFVSGAWQVVDCGFVPPDPNQIRGTRVTFEGAIPPGETGSVDLELATTDAAAGLTEDTTVTNDIESVVELDGESADAPASDDFVLRANSVQVGASKQFDPDLVIAGDPSTVTIGGSNESAFTIDSLTLTEPSSGSFPDEYHLTGIGPVSYPANATGATITYQPGNRTVSIADGASAAEPALGWDSVTSFSVEFTGPIIAGGEGSVDFDIVTDPNLPPATLPTTVNNEVAVEGENDGATGEASADDDLQIYGEVIESYVDKTIRPSQIVADAGQVVTVSLEGGTTERPNPPDDPTGTTGRADQVVIQDPADPVEPNAWWNAFDLDSIAQTPIPSDATLTIYYWDTEADQWVVLDGPIAGPGIYSSDVPADIAEVAGGVRFVYDYTGDDGGFAPGTDFTPNFTSSLRPEGRYDGEAPPYNTDPNQPHTLIPNCAQTDATSPNPGVPGDTAAMHGDDCPEIELIPPAGDGGTGDLIDKDYGRSSSGGDATVIARSGDTIPSTLSWSTGGYSGLQRVWITDVPNPGSVDVADTVYDAFDVIRVEPITAAQDPFLTYDQVAAVRLFNGSRWVDATNDPCPAACDGTFPGVDLTAAEQESTLSVRLVFRESPTRGPRTEGDLDAPPVGSGVARSFGNNRQVTLLWRVRDTHRSDADLPALGDDSPAPESSYNTGSAGLVRNDARATGFFQSGRRIVGNASDTVQIIDVPITQTTSKDWLGGPVAVPSPGTPVSDYPRSRLRVTTTNTTPARVDQLRITETAPGSVTPGEGPFDYFRLVRIAGINVPSGATSTQVVLTCANGRTRPTGSPGYYTREQALALTTMPCDVVRVQVLFDGRIESDASGVLALDVRLRARNRVTGQAAEPDTRVFNTALGVVADVDAIQDCPPGPDDRYACDEDDAFIDIVAPTFGIAGGKTISPDTQVEGDDSPVTVTLTAQNTGSTRPYLDQITDDDPTFWNAMDFVAMDPSWVLPQPVKFVRACYLSGGSFTDTSVAADAVGGTWTCQPLPGGGPPFDDGELTLDQARAFIDGAPADLHGLRFQFMANSEVGWQNPAHPLIQVPFQVQRRENLRSGGPVPTTRSDQTPAPGEDNAGVFVDTVEVSGESVLVGPDNRLTAEDTADAPYTYEHLVVGVEVDKTPAGELPPGAVIPFTLSFTNTGEAPLHNPVFTDQLPTDAEGPQLIFDPDSDPAVNPPYDFELEGPAPTPPNGDPLPTDQDEITITQTGDSIVFEMPEGTVLEPGQTYTITIDLMLRPGLTPDDVLVNTATVISDDPFDPDACTPTYVAATGECEDDTAVSPVRVAALSTVKKVKADVPVVEPGVPEIYLDRDVLPEGVEVPDDYCDTAADAAGFYRSPCVPVTYPGDTETWRFTITNAGTIPIDTLVSVDSLPHVGDQGLIVTLPRESEWDPTFAQGIQLVDGDGGTLTTFYSTSYQPCLDDIDPLGSACPDGAWLPLTGAVPPVDVASLKFVVSFPDGNLFAPGDRVALEFKTRTTPQEPADSTFPVAWNTVATGGISNDGGARANITATEGRKVGVTYPTGPIALRKVVTGDGAEYAPDSFDVQLECTLNGEPMTGLPVVTLPTNGDPVEVDGLPWGAVCTASEADQGQTSDSADTATVGGPEDDIGLVTVSNVFELGDMSVTKSVESEAIDQDGNPIEYGPFQVAVTCRFLGNEVVADGYTSNPMTHTIAEGETWVLTGLPVGARCEVTEPDSRDAADVNITPASIVIEDQVLPVQVVVENVFGAGSLHLRKQVFPAAVEELPISAGPFTLHVTCTLTDPSHPDGEVVYDDVVVLEGPQPLETTIDDIAAGAVCRVTEPDPAAATAHVIVPRKVTIEDDDTVDVVATNLFGSGALRITKTVDGPGADRYGAGPFEVTLNCSYTNAAGDEVPLETPGGPTRELSADDDYTALYQPLLFGSTCTIEETRTGGATSTVITDADGNQVSEFTVESLTEDLQLDVTNTFDVGSIQVRKRVVGPGPGHFVVELACSQDVDGSDTPVDIPGGASRPLDDDNDFRATYDELPVGAECTLVETDDGGAQSTTITPNDGDPDVGAVTVGDGTSVRLDVVNRFPDLGPDTTGGGSGGLLPDTGAGRWLLALAVAGFALAAAGAALVGTSRRRKT